MHQKRKLPNIVPYFHVYLNGLTNGYTDIKDKLLANITDKSYCKQFVFCFEAVQTIYFGVSSSANFFFFKFLIPPSRKTMVRPLNGTREFSRQNVPAYGSESLSSSAPVGQSAGIGRVVAGKMYARALEPFIYFIYLFLKYLYRKSN